MTNSKNNPRMKCKSQIQVLSVLSRATGAARTRVANDTGARTENFIRLFIPNLKDKKTFYRGIWRMPR